LWTHWLERLEVERIKRVGTDLLGRVREDKVVLVSAGVAFFAFLALVPTLIAALSVYGIVADPQAVPGQIEPLLSRLPGEAQTLLVSQLKAIAAGASGTLGWSVVVSLAVALWSASSGTAHLLEAVNLAFDRHGAKNVLKKRARAFGFTLLFIVFGLLAMTATALAFTVVRGADWIGWGRGLATAGIWLILGLAVAVVIATVYRFGPRGDRPPWRWVTAGSIVAVLLWVLATVGFQIYVSNFGSYNETYGSISAVVILLFWLFISAFAVVMGAELNASLEEEWTATTSLTDG